MRTILMAAVILACSCTTMETIYTTNERGDPLVYMKRVNVVRVGQGLAEVTTDGKDATVKQAASDAAMSDQTKEAWAELNKTAKYIAIGAGVGAAIGQPVVGGVVGGVASKLEDMVRGDDEPVDVSTDINDPSVGEASGD